MTEEDQRSPAISRKTKIVEKKLETGKWRLRFNDEITGHTITAVHIKGLRGRPWPLFQVSFEEFKERFPFDYTNEKPAPITRGIPSLWTVHTGILHLWPAPANDWTLQVRMQEK